MEKPNLSHLADKWPSSVVAREKVGEFTGGIITPKTLANLDSIGDGPPKGRHRRKIFYKVDDLVSWMESRAKLAA